jgi:hypothetical protein
MSFSAQNVSFFSRFPTRYILLIPSALIAISLISSSDFPFRSFPLIFLFGFAKPELAIPVEAPFATVRSYPNRS